MSVSDVLVIWGFVACGLPYLQAMCCVCCLLTSTIGILKWDWTRDFLWKNCFASCFFPHYFPCGINNKITGQKNEILILKVRIGPVCAIGAFLICRTKPEHFSLSGDPLRFHAHFIAVCLSADESIFLLDILAVARLGSNVKKTVLLCSPGPDTDILYTSLQWSRMV